MSFEIGDEVRLESERLSIGMSHSHGGAITSVRVAGEERLAGAVPGASRIEEFFGSSDGSLHRAEWKLVREEDSVQWTTFSDAVMIEKRIRLHPDAPALFLDYHFVNGSPIFVRPSFGLRLVLSIEERNLRWHMPTAAGMRSDSPASFSERRYIRPSVNAVGVATGPNHIALLFPEGTLDAVEVRSQPDIHQFALSPTVYYIGLCPDGEARMTALVHFEPGLPETLSGLWKTWGQELNAGYGTASLNEKDRVAQQVAKQGNELESREIRQRRIELRDRAKRLDATQERRMELLRRLETGSETIQSVINEFRKGE